MRGGNVVRGDSAGQAEHLVEEQRTHVFIIEADADADVLSRVANQFAYANVGPRQVSLVQDRAGIVRIRVELAGVRSVTAELIRRKLVQLTCVIGVQLSHRNGHHGSNLGAS